MHEVTPVISDRIRYSIFGWYFKEGKLYDIPKPEDIDEGENSEE